jgi:hypothetical protein
MRMQGCRVSRKDLAAIRKTLRANPGASIRTHRGEDGQMQVSIARGGDPLRKLQRYAELRWLKVRADEASTRLLEDRL